MDIRWQRRFNNFKKAFIQLREAVEIEHYSSLEKEGLIQRFEYTYELAWKTLKDFLEHKGNEGILGSRDAIKLAFQLGIIEDGEAWMRMIKSRTLTSHTYDEETANEIATAVKEDYFKLFDRLLIRLEEEQAND
ncbi:MAG TPA: nucleotidyltransferase substrate binding protein [Segetibacter sp.]|jgi:nucleotidyltransferase substrate binding protein (TIGR01987 family)